MARERSEDARHSPFLCGGLLLAWPESLPATIAHSPFPLHSAWRTPYPQANTADSLAVYLLPATTHSSPLVWPNQAKMASTGVPVSSCCCPPDSWSGPLQCHRFTPVLFVILGSYIKTESKVTVGPTRCVIKMNNGRKLLSAMLIRRAVWNTCCILSVQQCTQRVHVGKFFCTVCVYTNIYIYIYTHTCDCVADRGAAAWEMR